MSKNPNTIIPGIVSPRHGLGPSVFPHIDRAAKRKLGIQAAGNGICDCADGPATWLPLEGSKCIRLSLHTNTVSLWIAGC